MRLLENMKILIFTFFFALSHFLHMAWSM